MNLQSDPHSLAVMKFGVGQPVPRSEDATLVRGRGCYTDDVKLAGEAYAVMVRSRVAHGVIKRIDTAAAQKMPGVLGVYTGADLAQYGTLKCIVAFNNRDGTPMKKPPRPALATDKVRFVGDPVAFVVAETLLQAKDAAEAVEVDIDPLPAVIRPEDAARPGAPLIYGEAPGNVALDYHYGDADAVAAAFAKAAHVTRIKLVNSRVVVNAIEPRAAVGVYERASGRFTLRVPSQGVFGMKGSIAEILKVEPKQVRIVSGHVGGAVPRIRLRAARREGARPPGQMERRALDELRLRQPRPRPRGHRRARARRRWHVPGAAAYQLRQYGRLSFPRCADAVDDQRGEERAEPLPHAADRGLHQMRVHQHESCIGLSRGRPAGRQLLHGAADRRGRRGARNRSAGIAPPQYDPAARYPAQNGLRQYL